MMPLKEGTQVRGHPHTHTHKKKKRRNTEVLEPGILILTNYLSNHLLKKKKKKER